MSTYNFRDLRDQAGVFSGVTAIGFGNFTLARPGEEPHQAAGQPVTANYFDVLGVTPILGRGFRKDEDATLVDTRSPCWAVCARSVVSALDVRGRAARDAMAGEPPVAMVGCRRASHARSDVGRRAGPRPQRSPGISSATIRM
jgi:hypothetical protein